MGKKIADWRPEGRIIRDRPRKRGLDDVQDDLRCMNVRDGDGCVMRGRNGRKSLSRLKPTLGCNAGKWKERTIETKRSRS